MKTLLVVILTLTIVAVAPFTAQAAAPKITTIGAAAGRDGREALVTVWTNFERGNSVRIVHCLVEVTRNNSCRGGLKKVMTPKLTCKRPGNCVWAKNFRAKFQNSVSGYVVVSNSDGSVRKRWIAPVGSK